MQTSAAPRWLIRGIGSATVVPAILVALVALALWARQPAAPMAPQHWLPLLITLGAVASGCAALAWVRPQRAGLSPPHVMLSLGFGGMLLGLLYDGLHAGPAGLESLCLPSGAPGFWDSLALHLVFLPGMHAGMLAGGLLAIPGLRLLHPRCGRTLCSLFAQNLLCSGWMLAGMTAGALWLSRSQFTDSTLSGMLGGMFVGMTWGMVVSVALYRAYFSWRSRGRDGSPNRARPAPRLSPGSRN